MNENPDKFASDNCNEMIFLTTTTVTINPNYD